MVGRLAFSLATVSASYVEIKRVFAINTKEVNRKRHVFYLLIKNISHMKIWGSKMISKIMDLLDLRIDGDKYYFQDISIANAIKRLFEDKDFHDGWLENLNMMKIQIITGFTEKKAL